MECILLAVLAALFFVVLSMVVQQQGSGVCEGGEVMARYHKCAFEFTYEFTVGSSYNDTARSCSALDDWVGCLNSVDISSCDEGINQGLAVALQTVSVMGSELNCTGGDIDTVSSAALWLPEVCSEAGLDTVSAMALGLKSGTKALIPLFLTSVFANYHALPVLDEFDWLAQPVAMVVLGLLAACEFIAGFSKPLRTAEKAVNSLLKPFTGFTVAAATVACGQQAFATAVVAGCLALAQQLATLTTVGTLEDSAADAADAAEKKCAACVHVYKWFKKLGAKEFLHLVETVVTTTLSAFVLSNMSAPAENPSVLTPVVASAASVLMTAVRHLVSSMEAKKEAKKNGNSV